MRKRINVGEWVKYLLSFVILPYRRVEGFGGGWGEETQSEYRRPETSTQQRTRQKKQKGRRAQAKTHSHFGSESSQGIETDRTQRL